MPPPADAGGDGIKALSRICKLCVTDGVPRRSFAVAALVGTLLNLINQGDALLVGESLDWLKIVLTFLVPYCVATYGAVSYRLRIERRAVR
jgi:hypothetical protein